MSSRDYLGLAVAAIFIAYFVFQIIRIFSKTAKIRKNGIETYAEVTRIDTDTDSEGNTSEYAIVTYKDESGKKRQADIAVTVFGKYHLGDRIKVRYIPGEYGLVVEVKEK